MVNTCAGGCGLAVSSKGKYRKGHEENPCVPDSHKAEADEAMARYKKQNQKYR